MMYVRLKVTISLYLSPNSMARSWPTLTAVIVERHLTYHTARLRKTSLGKDSSELRTSNK